MKRLSCEHLLVMMNSPAVVTTSLVLGEPTSTTSVSSGIPEIAMIEPLDSICNKQHCVKHVYEVLCSNLTCFHFSLPFVCHPTVSFCLPLPLLFGTCCLTSITSGTFMSLGRPFTSTSTTASCLYRKITLILFSLLINTLLFNG